MAEKRGRKCRYFTDVEPNLELIAKMARTMTEKQIADCLGISYSGTWAEYKKKFPELSEALKKGRQDLVSDLHGALIKRALGYDYTETKEIIQSVEWDKETYEQLIEAGLSPETISSVRTIKKEISHKKMPPDVAALNLALKNYDKRRWANDPQTLALRKKELELRKRQIENNSW